MKYVLTKPNACDKDGKQLKVGDTVNIDGDIPKRLVNKVELADPAAKAEAKEAQKPKEAKEGKKK